MKSALIALMFSSLALSDTVVTDRALFPDVTQMPVSVDSMYDSVHHVGVGYWHDGSYTDDLSPRSQDYFNFSQPIIAFGADFDFVPNAGLAVNLIRVNQSGFFGIIFDQPVAGVWVTTGYLDGSYQAYTISNIEASAAPEPAAWMLIAGGIGLCAVLRRRAQ